MNIRSVACDGSTDQYDGVQFQCHPQQDHHQQSPRNGSGSQNTHQQISTIKVSDENCMQIADSVVEKAAILDGKVSKSFLKPLSMQDNCTTISEGKCASKIPRTVDTCTALAAVTCTEDSNTYTDDATTCTAVSDICTADSVIVT